MHSARQVPFAHKPVPLVSGDSLGNEAVAKTPGERLRQLRKNKGYTSIQQAADAMGVKKDTLAQHENATQGRGVPRDAAIKYAKFYRVSTDFILTGKGNQTHKTQTPVVGYIGAGAEVFPVDDHAKGEGLDKVDPPSGIEFPCVAARVRGDSMYPMLEDGWLVFWTRDNESVPEECLNKLCVVQVKDGPMLVKRLRRGSRAGLFNLESHNAPLRTDVALEWAARVLDIRPA